MADLDIRIRMDSSGAESSTRNLTQAVSAIGAQATRSQGVLANMMIGFNQGLELARKAMQAIQGVFDSTVGSAMKFESALKEVTTLFNATAEDQARLTEEVLRFQKQFGADVINTTKAYYQAISSGAVDATTAQELMISANKLAIGGVTDVETAVNGLTNAISGFGLTASDSTRISDLLFIGMKNGKTTVGELSGNIGLVSSTANALGISLEETVASMSALTTAGISTNVATTQLKALMTNLVKPTDELSKAFKQAGIESIDLALKQDGLIGVLGKIKGTTDGSASSLQKLFGSVEAGSAVLSLTGEQAKTFNKNMLEMGEASKNVGATTEEAFGKITASAEYQMNLLKGNVSAIFTEIGIAIIPILASALQTVNEAFKNSGEVVNSIKSIYSTYKEEIIALGAFLGTLGVALAAHAIAVNISSIAWGAYTIATNIATVATTAFTAVMAVLTSPITAVVVALGALVAGIVYYTRNQDLCNGYIKQFAAFALDLVIPSINLLIDSFVETQRALDILGGGLQIAMGYFSKLVSFIAGNVISGFDVFLLAIQEVVGVFDKDMAQSIENTRNNLKGFSQSLKDSSDAMIENGRETIKNALTSEEYGNKKEDLKNKVKALSDSLMQEGMAQVDLAKKQDATKEGLNEIANSTSNLSTNTKELTDNINKNSGALETNKEKKKRLAEEAKALKKAEKEILDEFVAQAKAIDEITKEQDKYIESLQKTRDEIGNQKGLADGISGALKLINTSVELQAISDVLGAEKVAIQVVEAERMKSFGRIEESELIYQKLRADAEVELSKEQIKAVERKKEREAKSIKENALTFKEVMQQSLEYVSIGYDAIKSVISTSLDYFKQGIDLISGSLYNNITQSISLFTSIPENLEKSFDGFSKIITEGIPQAIEKMPKIVDKIIKETPKIIASLEKNLPKLIDVIVESIPKILPPMIKAFTSAFLAIIPKIPSLISAIVKQIPTLIRGLMQVIPALIKEVPKILDVILKEIPSIIKELVAGLPDIIKALVKAIPQIISSIISNLPDIIMALIYAMPQIMDAIIAEIPNLIVGIIKNLPQLITSLVEKMPQIAVALINAIISLVGSVIDAFIPGFSDGVKKVFQWINDNIFQPIFDGFMYVFSWINDNVFQPILNSFEAVFLWINENVFKPVIEAFTALFTWVNENIFQPILKSFELVFNWINDNIFMPFIGFIEKVFTWINENIFIPIINAFELVFTWINDNVFIPFIGFIEKVFAWVNENIFMPIVKAFETVFNWINNNIFIPIIASFEWLFNWVNNNVFMPIVSAFESMFTWVNDNIFQPVISGFRSMFDWVKSNIFDPIVSAFKSITNTFDSIIRSIEKAVDDVKGAFTITNSVSQGQWYDPGEWFGGGSGWFSKGGMVGGSALVNGDSKVNDTVPAMLSPGEIVIPRTAVQKGKTGIDGFLGRLGFYNGGVVGKQSFAMGGVVTDNAFLNKLGEILQVFLDKFSVIINKVGQNISSTPSSLSSVVSGLSSYSPSATLSTYKPPSGLGTGVVSFAQAQTPTISEEERKAQIDKKYSEDLKKPNITLEEIQKLQSDYRNTRKISPKYEGLLSDLNYIGNGQYSYLSKHSDWRVAMLATDVLEAKKNLENTSFNDNSAWNEAQRKYIASMQSNDRQIADILNALADEEWKKLPLKMARGGVVGNNGIDSKQYDTVPAMLSRGEIVLPKSAVKGGLPSMVSFIQDVLGMQKQQYAFGGMVDLAQAGKGTMSISNVSSSNTALNDEIKNLRNEIRAIGTALLRDTVSINRTMTQWNGEGLPSDRGY